MSPAIIVQTQNFLPAYSFFLTALCFSLWLLCPLWFQVSSPAWQAGHIFLHASYEGRVFTCPASGEVLFTPYVGSIHLCTPLVWEMQLVSLRAFYNSPQPVFILFISDLATAAIIKMCSCLLHNSSQAEAIQIKRPKCQHKSVVCTVNILFSESSYIRHSAGVVEIYIGQFVLPIEANAFLCLFFFLHVSVVSAFTTVALPS